MELPKDREGLISLARSQGWSIDKTERGHLKLTSPSGKRVHGSGTPSDWRADANFRMQLKRAGLKPPPGVAERKPLVLPEPKLVVDRGVQVVTEATLPTEVRRKPGEVIDVVISAMRRVNRGGGMDVADILTHVKAKLPEQDERRLSVSLANMAISGYIRRTAVGRYEVVEGFVPVKKKYERKPKAAAVAKKAANNDALVLENALAALAELEALIRRYQPLLPLLGQFKGLMEAMGGNNGGNKGADSAP